MARSARVGTVPTRVRRRLLSTVKTWVQLAQESARRPVAAPLGTGT
jgi:hypothetical protein